MNLPHRDDSSLPPLRGQTLSRCQPHSVVTATDGGISRPTSVSFPISSHGYVSISRVPCRSRVPSLDPFVAPFCRHHEYDETVPQVAELVDAIPIDRFLVLYLVLDELAGYYRVDGSYAPSRGHHPPVLFEAECSDAECPLHLRDRNFSSVEV